MTAQYDRKAFTKQRAALHNLVTRFLLRPLLTAVYRVSIDGLENIPADGPLVVVSNHLSLVDPPLLGAVIGRPMAYVAKEELFAIPGVSALIKFCGAISVNRAQPGLSTFKVVRKVLGDGWALAMFIEGTRNKTPGILGRPHQGPAFCAHSSEAPILPVGIVGTDRLFGPAVVRIGKLIEPENDIEATTWKIMTALSDLTGYALPERDIAATIKSWVPARRPRT